MPLDLTSLSQVRTRWLTLTGQLRGVELLIRYASPKDTERFRQKLVRAGVMKSGRDEGWQINSGREDDFFKMFADYYVVDWRGDIHDGNGDAAPSYNSEKMGNVLGAYKSAFEQLSRGVEDDAGFFEPSNEGS